MKKTNELIYVVIISGIILSFSNCKKDNNGSTTTIQNVTGYAQKGPFINGSSITVYDLNSDLSPTGKSYNVQITDNKGTFELNDILLSSKYVSLRADGFYFNEVKGEQSVAQITLYALSDVSGKSIINVNLLTHLEKARVEYLMKNNKSFNEAKIQAQKEILSIFDFQKSDSIPSESLDISEGGKDNGILLAISAILQGHHSESELTGLLSNISNDINSDGVLNSENLYTELIDQAIYIDTGLIKNNLVKWYSNLGVAIDIPNFGNYLNNFISKSTNSSIYYPSKGLWGSNILSLKDTSYFGSIFSFAAYLPKDSTLKVVISALDSDGIWYYAGTIVGVTGTLIYNWSVSDFSNNSQIFTSTKSATFCDLRIMNFAPGRYMIEYYESGSNTPTGKKIIRF